MQAKVAHNLLIPAAVILAAAAATPANAALIGGCPSPLRPPPCIVIDKSKITNIFQTIQAQTETIRQITQEIETMRDLTKSIAGADGRIGLMGGIQPIAPGRPINIETGINGIVAAQSRITGVGRTQWSDAVRNVPTDSLAYALTLKARLADFSRKQEELLKASEQSTSLRQDIQINSQARMLFQSGLMLLNEARAQRMMLVSAPITTDPAINQQPGKPEPRRLRPLPPPKVASLPEFIDPEQIVRRTEAADRARLLELFLDGSETASTAVIQLRETMREMEGIRTLNQQNRRDLQAAAMREAEKVPRNRRQGRSTTEIADMMMQASLAQMTASSWDSEQKGARFVSGERNIRTMMQRTWGISTGDRFLDLVRKTADSSLLLSHYGPLVADAEVAIADLGRSRASLASALGLANDARPTIEAALKEARATAGSRGAAPSQTRQQ